jgi:hypothetical protein
METSINFSIDYDGQALENHSIDIKELAPALMSIGSLLEETNAILNIDKTKVKVNVKALSAGSFEIFIEASQNFLDTMTNIFTGKTLASLANVSSIFGFLFGGGALGGLFILIQKLRGAKPDKIEDLKNGLYRITCKELSYDIPFELLELYKNYAVRKAVEGIIKPLKSEGITKLKVKNNKKETVYETLKEDAYLFDAPQIPEEELQKDEKTMYFSLVSISFKEDNKWRLNDGNSTVNVSIEDNEFIDKIKQNTIAFSCGDTLKCNVRITQKRTAAGLKTEYEIIKVIEHKPAYKQLELF